MREAIYQYGLPLVRRFFEANGIPLPTFYRYSDTALMDERTKRYIELVAGMNEGTTYGVYWNEKVFVNVDKSRLPVQNPGGMSWSYPCWKTDRTAIGILAHECGHHVQEVIQDIKKLVPDGYCWHIWKQNIMSHKKSRAISGYQPNHPMEAFAETMRLFILNPDLLHKAIPIRYAFIHEYLQLTPIETRPWQEVLLNHPAYIQAGERWIKHA